MINTLNVIFLSFVDSQLLQVNINIQICNAALSASRAQSRHVEERMTTNHMAASGQFGKPADSASLISERECGQHVKSCLHFRKGSRYSSLHACKSHTCKSNNFSQGRYCRRGLVCAHMHRLIVSQTSSQKVRVSILWNRSRSKSSHSGSPKSLPVFFVWGQGACRAKELMIARAKRSFLQGCQTLYPHCCDGNRNTRMTDCSSYLHKEAHQGCANFKTCVL